MQDVLKVSPKKELARFLAEDLGKGDITSRLLPNKTISARIITREKGIVAGAKYAKMLLSSKGCTVKIVKNDGRAIQPNDTVLEIRGPARSILSAERTVLNLLSRMSGIATQTRRLVEKTKGTRAKIYATRKTAPGLRFFDKEAVALGGGEKHRMTLDEMILIKDNHLAVAESFEKIVRDAKRTGKKFEVEVENLQDAITAAREGATIVMLDNFTPRQITQTIRELKKQKLRNKIMLEASGGINLKNARKYAKTGVDIISIGNITNSVKAIDYSLEV